MFVARLFPNQEEAKDYIEAYAKHFDLFPSIQFHTEVLYATQQNGGGWAITTKSLGTLKETTQSFDALVACTGLYNKPHHPLADTLKDYTGHLMHAQQFKSVKDYQGKRVLVVGSVVSGPEISSILATQGNCKMVTIVYEMYLTICPKYLPSITSRLMIFFSFDFQLGLDAFCLPPS